MIEHRWNQRFNTGQDAFLLTSRDGAVSGLIRNVCQQGLYVETDLAPPKNAYVEVQVCTDNHDVDADYRFLAMVVHRDKNGAGLLANTADPKAASALQALMQQNLHRHSRPPEQSQHSVNVA